MPHLIKEGDVRTLVWNLGRDLTGVASAEVIISDQSYNALIQRSGSIIDIPGGLVGLALTTNDWNTGVLDKGEYEYLAEVKLPGPIRHPDQGYERIIVSKKTGT